MQIYFETAGRIVNGKADNRSKPEKQILKPKQKPKLIETEQVNRKTWYVTLGGDTSRLNRGSMLLKALETGNKVQTVNIQVRAPSAGMDLCIP